MATPDRPGSSGSSFPLNLSYRFLRTSESYLLLLPALAVLAVLFFWPALYNFILSFQKISLFELAKGGQWVGTDNFSRLFGDPEFWVILRNTTFYLTIVTVVMRLVLGLGIALLLDAAVLSRWRLAGVARTLLLLPWITSPVVAVATWKWLLDPRYGAVNQLLLEAGVIGSGIPFFVRVSTVWGAILVVIIWRELPFVVLALLAGLNSIPGELYEAAEIDGASGPATFWHIKLPLLRPVMSVVAMLTIIWTYNNFVYVWLSTQGGPGNYTQVLATQIYTEAFANYRLGLGAAVGVVMSFVMLLFSAVYFLYFFRKDAN